VVKKSKGKLTKKEGAKLGQTKCKKAQKNNPSRGASKKTWRKPRVFARKGSDLFTCGEKAVKSLNDRIEKNARSVTAHSGKKGSLSKKKKIKKKKKKKKGAFPRQHFSYQQPSPGAGLRGHEGRQGAKSKAKK